jgi:chemotaxis family two-component system sensor kinase Cph1
MVAEVREELSPLQHGRVIDWHVQALPAVAADAVLLRTVWVNLLSNALKFTARQPRTQIEIGARQENGETVFHVRDNGVGFDMLHAEKLFGVFQRLHRREDFDGTGIGLATVRRIVERHGGRVWGEGAVNQGATIYFTVPNRPREVGDGQ